MSPWYPGPRPVPHNRRVSVLDGLYAGEFSSGFVKCLSDSVQLFLYFGRRRSDRYSNPSPSCIQSPGPGKKERFGIKTNLRKSFPLLAHVSALHRYDPKAIPKKQAEFSEHTFWLISAASPNSLYSSNVSPSLHTIVKLPSAMRYAFPYKVSFPSLHKI